MKLTIFILQAVVYAQNFGSVDNNFSGSDQNAIVATTLQPTTNVGSGDQGGNFDEETQGIINYHQLIIEVQDICENPVEGDFHEKTVRAWSEMCSTCQVLWLTQDFRKKDVNKCLKKRGKLEKHFWNTFSWMMVDELCAQFLPDKLADKESVEYFCGKCSNLSPEEQASNEKHCRALMKGKDERVKKVDIGSLVNDICKGDVDMNLTVTVRPEVELRSAWEAACTACNNMEWQPIDNFSKKEINSCRKSIKFLMEVKQFQEKLDDNIYATEEYQRVKKACGPIWDGNDSAYEFMGEKVNQAMLQMCGTCMVLNNMADVLKCRKDVKKAEKLHNVKEAKLAGKKIFEFSWAKVSQMCTNVESHEFKDEEERAFFIAKCIECDPNNISNLGVDMNKKKKDCKNAFKLAVADKKEAHKKKQFSWKNMEEFCQEFEAMTGFCSLFLVYFFSIKCLQNPPMTQFLGDINTTLSTENQIEKDAETQALMNMCGRCSDQRQGKKKGGLCRKKWAKLVESRFDEE